MKINLEEMTPQELEDLQAKIEKAKEKKHRENRKAALKAAEAAAAEFGYTLQELVGGAEKPATRGRARAKGGDAKYRNPENPSETWTGRGRRPEWYKAAIESGKSPADLEI